MIADLLGFRAVLARVSDVHSSSRLAKKYEAHSAVLDPVPRVPCICRHPKMTGWQAGGLTQATSGNDKRLSSILQHCHFGY